MSTVLAFAIKDIGSPEIFGVIMKTEDRFINFDLLKDLVLNIRESRYMRDKFDLPMAADEVVYEIVSVAGVPIGTFVFREVTRMDWAEDGVSEFISQNTECQITKLDGEALANVIRNSFREASAADVAGPWKGIYHSEVSE